MTSQPEILKIVRDYMHNGSAVFSPLSLNIALTCLYNTTYIRNFEPLWDIYEASDVQCRVLNTKSKKTEITIKTGIWGDPDNQSSWRRERMLEVLGNLEEFPKSEMARIPIFSEEATKGKVVVPCPGPDVSLAVVNCLYMKAAWWDGDEFGPPTPGAFVKEDGTAVTRPFMTSHEGGRKFLKGKNFTSVTKELTGSVGFTAVLPDTNLGDLINSTENILDFLPKDRESVRLTMPKFKVKSDFDFSKMVALDGLSINQGCVLDVDDKGIEGSAATSIQYLEGACYRPEPIHIKFNRPFLFMITETFSSAILFVGVYQGD